MTNLNNSLENPNNSIESPSDLGPQLNNLVSMIILQAIDDDGLEAFNDEGIKNWSIFADINLETLAEAVEAMPVHYEGKNEKGEVCCKGKKGCQKVGQPDVRLAMRHINENRDG
tara:strand:+ start:384 stop:725 length:342 start_codon:yes stop_codon:yes gene_type:complete